LECTVLGEKTKKSILHPNGLKIANFYN